LVTYGGPLEFYEPALNTIDGQLTSSDISAVERKIRAMDFDGPAYHSSVTARALEFVTTVANMEHKGIFSHVVLFAPETDVNVSFNCNLNQQLYGIKRKLLTLRCVHIVSA